MVVNQYGRDGNRNVRIKKLENVMTKVFHQNYKGGSSNRIQDYEDSFTEFVLLVKNTWNEDEIVYWFKIHRILKCLTRFLKNYCVISHL
jgi:hypothetical protein